MLKLFYYYNWFLLVLCFVLLFNVCRLESSSASQASRWIAALLACYYAVLQFCVIVMRRKGISPKSFSFAGLVFCELLPIGYIIFQVLS
jgi:glucan phosphoethanolaminetransferase (alkaline phosphatase superfamily)